jgi:signal transduction histidine kinase
MRERLEMVGGHFGVESAPGKGTTIIAQIPPGKPVVLTEVVACIKHHLGG